MSDLNIITLVGEVASDVKSGITKNNKPYASFTEAKMDNQSLQNIREDMLSEEGELLDIKGGEYGADKAKNRRCEKLSITTCGLHRGGD